MAVWHFICQVIPDTGRAAQDVAWSAVFFDPAACWMTAPTPDAKELVASLQTLGEPQGTWDVDTVQWGAEEGTYVKLCREEGKVVELSLGLDLRQPWPPLVERFLQIARAHQLVLVTEPNPQGGTRGEVDRLLTPTIETLREATRACPAARFVADPAAFLGALERHRP